MHKIKEIYLSTFMNINVPRDSVNRILFWTIVFTATVTVVINSFSLVKWDIENEKNE